MVDMGFMGPRFTWSNLRSSINSIILERLDRYYANPSWLSMHPDSTVTHLPRTHSNHCPLLLSLSKPPKPNYLFRLETMWFSHTDFNNIVNHHRHQSSIYHCALKHFTSHVKDWNKSTFGNIFHAKKDPPSKTGRTSKYD